MDEFTGAYAETALWSSTDDDGAPLDENYSITDIDQETMAKMEADCKDFQARFGELWDDDARAGHDFWLTRNGHGAGFWDGDYEYEGTLNDAHIEGVGDFLTKACREYGEHDLYVDGEQIFG